MKKSSFPDILDKKIPKSTKYENVQSTIDTGASMPKYMAKMEATGKLKDRKDELFKRVKVRMLANMLLREMELLPQGPLSSLTSAPSTPIYPSTPPTSGIHTPTLMGTTLSPSDSPSPPPVPFAPGQSSFLLLDVRDPEEYETARIKGAMSYPAAILSRAINYFTADLYYYKNKENKMILIYDEDEKIAVQAGNIFYQKGIDNIFVLHGGLRQMYEEFPDLVVGVLPPKPGTASGSKKGMSDRGSSAGSTISKSTTRSTSSRASSLSKTSLSSSKKPVNPNDPKPWK